MSRPASSKATAALAPVRSELVRAARVQAQALLDHADREADDTVRRARAEADALLDEACRQGEEDGSGAARAVLAQARRLARDRELAAHREAYEGLRRLVVEHVRTLRHSPGYPALLDRIDERARRVLGPDCQVTEHPRGGAVAVAGGRQADFTLDALAARVLVRIGPEAETLWRR